MHHLSVIPASSIPSVRLRGLAAAMAMVLLAGLASEAGAGCADYVIVTNPQFTADQAAGGVLPGAMAAEHSLPTAPCQGLGCQQREPLPAPPAPAFPAPPPQQDVAVLSTAWQWAALPALSALELSLAAAADGHRPRIERPPRV